MLILASHGTREDETHPIIVGEIAAQRIAVPRQQAAGQRLVGQFRAASPGKGRVRAGWVRISFRGTRQVAA
jgi:hypothetical protein